MSIDGMAETVEAVGRGRLVLRRFLRRRPAVFGLVVLIGLFAMAFGGPHLTSWSYTAQDYSAYLQPPSGRHWFGTTQIGEDVFAQTMRGLQKSLIIGLLAALLCTGLSAVVGAFAGYLAGSTDRVLMWLVDLLLIVPAFFVLAILSPLFRGGSWMLLIVLLGGLGWMVTARVVRGQTVSLREREFVAAARLIGVSAPRTIFRHILPSMASLLIIDFTIMVGAMVLGEASLSFFGFGVQPPDVSLGTLFRDGTTSALTYPWLFFFSGGLLVLFVLAVNLVGDGLRDAFDPGSGRGTRQAR